MFDFQQLFLCRSLEVTDSGVAAGGIGFRHPADLPLLVLFGHVTVPHGIGDVAYKLVVSRHDEDGIEVVHEDGFVLHPTGSSDPRMVAAWIPVRSRLSKGYHEAVLEFPGGTQAILEFQIT